MFLSVEKMLCMSLAALIFGCATTDSNDKDQNLTWEVQEVPPQTNPQSLLDTPVPQLLKIEKQTSSSGGLKQIRKLWDMNGDGRVDMIEVKAQGSKNIRVFDFDFDGEIDLVQDIH
jgi:hypothetical protein